MKHRRGDVHFSGFGFMTVKPIVERSTAWIAIVHHACGCIGEIHDKAGYTDEQLLWAWDNGHTRRAVITRPLDPT